MTIERIIPDKKINEIKVGDESVFKMDADSDWTVVDVWYDRVSPLAVSLEQNADMLGEVRCFAVKFEKIDLKEKNDG